MKIRVLNTVDWEGRCLEEENLLAMEKFNQEFPHIPTLHFMNAAYFTKGLDNSLVEKRIKRVIKNNDLLGLHIHCWRSLVEKSGLDFRLGPSFVYKDGIPTQELQKDDCGHDLSLSAYNHNEVIKLIKTSEDILKKYNLLNRPYFRAGGWMANSDTLKALKECHYTHDFSAVPPELLKAKRKNETLYKMIEPLWADINTLSRPYEILPNLWELPNTACLADYMPAQDFLNVFKAIASHQKDVIFVMGYHQETAHRFIDRVRNGIKLIESEGHEIIYDFDFLEPSQTTKSNQGNNNYSPLNA
ncbi:MAG: hypothetical protein ACO20H_04955 [Bacteriovoracaceae bacterium]